MFKICFYVPESHADIVKNAMFNAGAGKIGNYDQCAWQTLGMGQYRPLSGSNPYLGEQQQLNHEPEYQVEMVCADEIIETVITAMIAAHPYDTPAYSAWKIWQLNDE